MAAEHDSEDMSLRFSYDSPKQIASLLEKHGLRMNKRFGQNFLISKGGREKIISQILDGSPESIWEIGPGIGALTHELVRHTKELVLFEIDHGFIKILKSLFGDLDHVRIVEGDVLKTWKQESGVPSVVCGNLPYNIGAQVIASLIESGCTSGKMVFTLQKEVVQRICARPGTKAYSSFTVLCELYYDSSHLFDLRPGAFYPAPDVDSSVVLMRKRDVPLIHDEDRSGVISFLHALFHARRKTVTNNLKRTFGDVRPALESLGLDAAVRAERLDAVTICRLYELLKDRQKDDQAL
jgi:16S rRNA (adenine1518-N6/adenine1519-N6)-dimethyltransferase